MPVHYVEQLLEFLGEYQYPGPKCSRFEGRPLCCIANYIAPSISPTSDKRHSVNFASAPLLGETLFATGAPSQNYRPWKRRGPCLKTVRRVWLERAAVSS